MKLLLWFISVWLTFPAFGQSILNLDFEPKANYDHPLQLWYTKAQSHHFRVDTSLAKKGKGSLLIESREANADEHATIYTTHLPIDSLKGKIMRLQVHARSESSAVVQAYIAVVSNQEVLNNTLRMDTLPNTSQWYPLDLQLAIPPQATHVAFGFRMFGKGKVWFDETDIWINGTPYEDLPINLADSSSQVATSRPLTQPELDWMRKNSLSLQTTLPRAPLADLSLLKPLVSSAQVIGLGEVSHGSREIFLLKHRLLRYLVEQQGFTLFAIEADMGAAERLNTYVLGGKGEPKELLKGLGFWTWNTEELLALITWMRSYNEKRQPKVKFAGVDMQLPEVALEQLKQFAHQRDTSLLKPLQALAAFVEKARKSNLRSGILTGEEQTRVRQAGRQIYEQMETRKSFYLNFLTLEALSSLKQRLTLVIQFIEYQCLPLSEAISYRDACLAENLHYLIKLYGNEKVVLWAHNAHVSKEGMTDRVKPMGNYLKENYKDKYLSIGFVFAEGAYRGIDPKTHKLATIRAQSADSSSYEHVFNSLNKPLFLLDLRKVPLSKETQWLYEPRELRNVGAMPSGKEFSQAEIMKEFDMILFIKESTPAKAL